MFPLLLLSISITYAHHSPWQELILDSVHSSIEDPSIGAPFTLSCTADAPLIRMNFLKEDSDHVLPAKIDAEGYAGSVTVEHPTVENAGEYVCEMETKEGPRREVMQVYVRPTVVTRTPRFMQDSIMTQTVLVDEGEDALIECPIIGFPSPIIKWKYDEDQYKDAVSVNITKLIISNTPLSYYGSYFLCSGSNEFKIDGIVHQPTVRANIYIQVIPKNPILKILYNQQFHFLSTFVLFCIIARKIWKISRRCERICEAEPLLKDHTL